MIPYYILYVFYFFLIYIISTFTLHYYIFNIKQITHVQLPPSPPSLPIIGHLHYLTLPMHECLRDLSQRHGPLLYLQFGLRPFLVVSSAEVAVEIFKLKDLSFASRPQSPFGAGLLLGSTGFIMAPYGDHWRFMKKLSVTKLLGPCQVRETLEVRRKELSFFLHKLLDKARNNEIVDVGGEVVRLVNHTVSRMAMSTRWGDKEDEVCRTLMDRTVKLAGNLALTLSLGPFEKLGVWMFQWQMMKVNRRYDQLFENILRDREGNIKGGESKDLVDLLLEIYNDEDAKVKISRNHIKAFLLDIFLAGTNTLTGSIKWVMANLLNHPEAFKKLREEIEFITGKNRLVEEEDVPNLHYLQAIVKESMRLHPPFPLIPRLSTEDCQIQGFDVPRGTTVAVNAYAIMRDPQIWDEPDEFCPERFVVPRKEHEHRFDFVAFGGGRRMCPGYTMALKVVYSCVATMVQCFDWNVIGGVEGNKPLVSMEVKVGVTMEMLHPILCVPVVHFDPTITT